MAAGLCSRVSGPKAPCRLPAAPSLRGRAVKGYDGIRLTMDPVLRQRLERIASNHAKGSRDNKEPWSFLFRTEGAVSYMFFPLSGLDDWEFDGDLDGLDLPWSAERIDEIEEGAAPNEVELEQWGLAKCRWLADGTDWTWV